MQGRRIVLGVSGGIAAYKAIEVCRRLVDAGAHVVPVLTEGALHFVGATTFSALASEPAKTSLWDDDDPIPHTTMGQQADLIVVAPATAQIISAYATGSSRDLLSATLIATRAPVILCPAMHTEMWEHPAVQDNVARLVSRGVIIVEPESGRLAGGDTGHGRLAAPERIIAAVDVALGGGDLAGMSVIVSAGGTREPIDPVRFIGNRSSGRQGHAVAEAASRRGARVTLVTTSALGANHGIERLDVETAAQMYDALLSRSPAADIVVMAAAVADFRPATCAPAKLKKAAGPPEVVLEPTPDILLALGSSKPVGQTLVGFAAETSDLAALAAEKLTRKGLDLIVANDVSAPGVGFEHETNAVLVLGSDGAATEIPLSSKDQIAERILDLIVQHRIRQPDGSQEGAIT